MYFDVKGGYPMLFQEHPTASYYRYAPVIDCCLSLAHPLSPDSRNSLPSRITEAHASLHLLAATQFKRCNIQFENGHV